MGASSDNENLSEVLRHLNALERRLSLVEERLGLSPGQNPDEQGTLFQSIGGISDREEELEIQIGQNWFARIGVLVLTIGFAFLIAFPFQTIPPVVPSLFGYAVVAATLFVSYRWRDSLADLSRYILGGATVLLYFATLRLFFRAEPVISSKDLELFLLMVTVGFSMTVAVRSRSALLVALCLLAGYVTALLGDTQLFVVVICLLLDVAAIFLARRYGWQSLVVFATFATYMTYLLFVMNNPILRNEVQAIPVSPAFALSILLFAALFSAAFLFRESPREEEGAVITGAAVNGIAGYLVYLLVTFASIRQDMPLYHSAASLLFLLTSVAFWIREHSKYSTFVYAMLGYGAMSVAILAGIRQPDAFVWLAWQSIIVVSTAVWFRSRIIIAANFLIYLSLFLTYIIVAGTVGIVSVSFGFVALLSARILNWQKDRLELRTERMRDAYLTCAFFIFPYALYHVLPADYVSVSWVVVALFYYFVSVLLNLKKYRWMALLTLCLTGGRLFLVDMVNLDPTYRIISFLVLGVALFWISLVYARKKARRPAAAGQSVAASAPNDIDIHV